MLESIKTNSENFYLDITHKPADFVRNRFPMIYERLFDLNHDGTLDPLEKGLEFTVIEDIMNDDEDNDDLFSSDLDDEFDTDFGDDF